MRLIAVLALSLLIALPANARSLNRSEQRGLEAALAAYSDALAEGDAAALTEALPPRLLRFHAGLTGMEVPALEAAMTQQTQAMMEKIRFGALEADAAAAEANLSKLADGTRVLWSILPARFTMEQDGRTSRVDQPVLALRDDGEWYLLRVDPGQKRILAAVYPFLAEVDLPAMNVTPAE